MKITVKIKKALRDFTLDIDFTAQNEVFALLGASGSGKSMTLKCIAGIETPDEGIIILNGRTLFDSEQKINLPPQKRHVGYLFQNYALFPNMTVAENILFAAVGNDDEKVHKLKQNINRFKLNGLEQSYPTQLSGGQQQRVALARILSSNAEILLLDEPFAALDSYLKWQLELEMADVFKVYENTALLVSHDRGEVYRLADKIAIISVGNVDTIDDKHHLFQNPHTLSSALLTGCKNVSAVEKMDDSHIYASDWQINLSLKSESLCGKFVGMHSHCLQYRTEESENTFLMDVIQVTEDTFSYLIMVRRNNEATPVRWEVDKNFWQQIKSDNVYLHFPADKLIFLEK